MPSIAVVDPDVTAAFPRRPRSGIIMGLHLMQFALLGAALLLGTLAWFTPLVPSPFGGTAVGVAVALVLVALARVEDRPGYAWLRVRTSQQLRERRGDTVIARPITTTRPTRARFTPGARVTREAGVLPGRSAAITVISVDGVAYLHDPHQGTLSAVVAVTSPEFLLRDPADRNARVVGWGRVLAAATRTGRITQLHLLERSIPDDGSELAAWTNAHLSTDPVYATITGTYRELIGDLRGGADRHETYLVLTVDTSAVRAPKAERDAAMVAAWRQEWSVIARLLPAAGLTVTGHLGDRDLARIVRTAFDPTTALTLPTDSALTLREACPAGGREAWDHLRTDGAVHAVLWVAEWPRAQVAADILWPLVFPEGVQRCLSLFYKPYTRSQSEAAIRDKHSEIVQSAWLKDKLGRIETLADSKELDDVHARESELLAGHGEVGLLGMVTITAPTREDLDTALAMTHAAAAQASVDLRRVYGQQLQAFTAAALPLGTVVVA